MIRVFNVYYPVRTLVLMGGELLIITASFLLAVQIAFGEDAFLVLNYENGFYKVLGVTLLALLCLYYFDLYDPQRLRSYGETYFRLLVTLAALSFLLAGFGYFFPEFMLGNGVFLMGLTILTVSLFGWRATYSWLMRQPFLRENVFVLGSGPRAQKIVDALRDRLDLGMDVVRWEDGNGNGSPSRDSMAGVLKTIRHKGGVDRVIVSLHDRRGTLPVRELLDVRLNDVKVEDAADLLERINGKIEIDDLHPSWLIFSEGFRLNSGFLFTRRVVSVLVSFALLLVVLPLLPLIALVIRLSSPGPILYRQKRVGRNGQVFTCFKFRTMRADAEADTGPTWASDQDPRITIFGRFLRATRLDELPQLWNVFKGDMGFVGPRPERPEFVEWLSREIPYYNLRHLVRPGITGWAQINYPYGASMEEAKEKLKYDLYYIKNISLTFDLYIMFQTVKIVTIGRGAK